MDWIGILLNALPGTYAQTLESLLKKLAEARDATGSIPGEKLQEVYDWISENAQDAISPEAIANGVAELMAVLSGHNWGPPNQGAGGLV